MSAQRQPVPPTASDVPTGGSGWICLQPMQMVLPPTKLDHYLYKQSLGLGVAQVVLGSLCIVFNAISIGTGYLIGLAFVGHGIWCGILFIVTGAIGISAGVSKTKCKIVSYMVLCIISACLTAIVLSLGILGAVISSNQIDPVQCYNHYGYSERYSYYYRPPCSTALIIVGMEGGMAVCAFIAAILFIWGSVLCCKAKPCCYTPNLFQQVTLPVSYPLNNGMQMMHSTQYLLPTTPYQPGLPPAYHPGLAQTQPPQMQDTAAAAAAYPYPTPNPTQAFGQKSDYQPLTNC